MRTLIVSGIWPPDVGGPASHAPQVAEFLRARGHDVEVVTTAVRAPERRPYAVRWTSRALPKGVLHATAGTLVARRARRADVVYATGMLGRSAVGSVAARRPLVVKLTADPAYERARRRGLFAGDIDQFQRGGGGARASVLRFARDAELRAAAHVFCPSAFLRELAIGWGLDAARVSVLPNPAPDVEGLRARDELRARLGIDGNTLAFAGRLTAQKALDVALRAIAATGGVTFVVVGEGPERPALERLAAELGLDGRVRFVGARERREALELVRAADAALLSSAWENFPHAAVEALAVGTPVLASRVGGVAEIVRDGENGLLVEPGDAAALAAAIGRFFAEDELRGRLRAAAAPSVAELAPELVLGQLEETLARVAARR